MNWNCSLSYNWNYTISSLRIHWSTSNMPSKVKSGYWHSSGSFYLFRPYRIQSMRPSKYALYVSYMQYSLEYLESVAKQSRSSCFYNIKNISVFRFCYVLLRDLVQKLRQPCKKRKHMNPPRSIYISAIEQSTLNRCAHATGRFVHERL